MGPSPRRFNEPALQSEKNPDDVLIEKAKELNIFKSLFVIDECHNYLKSKENNVLVWWFTYHGHLYQDIILITQDLKLVNDEYKRVAEFFYKAVPQRLRFSKGTFKYRQYSSWQMYQKDYISTESLKANDKVFSMYVSGATVHTKPIIYKYLIIFFILILFVLYFFNDFLNSFEPPKKEEPKKEQIETNINQTQSIQQPINQTTQQPNNQNNQSILDNTKIEEDTTNLKLYKFNCFKDFCYYKQDKQITIEIPMPFLIAISKDMDKSNKYMLFEKNRTVIYLLANEEKLNFIKGVQNEKDIEKDNSFTGGINQPK